MNFRLALVLLAGAVGLTGCSSKLEVQVDVLHPRYVAQERRALEDYQLASALVDGDQTPRAAEVERLARLALLINGRCNVAMIDELTRVRQSLKAQDLINQVDKAVELLKTYSTKENQDKIFSRYKTEYENRLSKADEEARNALSGDIAALTWIKSPVRAIADSERPGSVKLPIQNPIPSSAARALAARSAVYHVVALDQGITRCSAPADYIRIQGLGEAAERESQVARRAVNAAIEAVETRSKPERDAAAATAGTLLGPRGVSLISDRSAYFVAAAPEVYWAQRFNRAYSRTKGGSGDIIIKQEDTAQFTVKGFTFDASQTAAMVSKVATSMVNIISRHVGAGIKVGSATENPAPATVTNSLADAEIAIAKSQRRDAAYEAALKRIAGYIYVNRAKLVAGDDDVEKSLALLVNAANASLTAGESKGEEKKAADPE